MKGYRNIEGVIGNPKVGKPIVTVWDPKTVPIDQIVDLINDQVVHDTLCPTAPRQLKEEEKVCGLCGFLWIAVRRLHHMVRDCHANHNDSLTNCKLIHRDETDALMSGVPNCIFRGFPLLTAAQAAFDYAEAQLWTRDLSSNYPTPIAALPQPISAVTTFNALSVSETEDNLWYVVYRGICPSVYRSQYA
jgi:hypothetical protein